MCHASPSHPRLVRFNEDFARRLEREATALAAVREELASSTDASGILEALESKAHNLAGAAGIFGFAAVSEAASVLEEGVAERRAGRGTHAQTQADLDALLHCIHAASAAAVSTI